MLRDTRDMDTSNATTQTAAKLNRFRRASIYVYFCLRGKFGFMYKRLNRVNISSRYGR